MKSILSLSCIAFIGFAAMGQAGNDDPVLMTVDGQEVTRSEFEAIYKKNNREASVSREALDEYMELFINYKLKVREAEVQGLDTVAKFEKELAGYREQLARPYLIDRELNEQLLREAHDRMQEEVRASHILVQVAPDASPEDTLEAWRRLNKLRDRIASGAEFQEVAKSKGGSDDPSAKQNGGDLGWFSALQMVYPFENAAYGTPVGEISTPVRTRFGYHIIQVNGRRPARGTMRAAHIMLRSSDTDDQEKQEKVAERIREIHRQLKEGSISFADAALRYSEDEGSSTKGGELPEFSTGKMIDEFEDAAFALSDDGAFSEPFRTRFGWHIVQRLSYKSPPSFEEASGELKNRIARDSRAEITRRAFLDRLKKDYGYKEERANVRALLPLMNEAIFSKGATTQDTILRKDLVEGPFQRQGIQYRRELNGTFHNGTLVNVRSKRHDELEQLPTDTVVVREVHEGWAYDRKRAERLTKPVFTMDGKAYTQRDLLDHLERNQRRERAIPLGDHLDARFTEFVDETVLAYENDRLEEKYPEFRMLMKEYRDGILLFELTDRLVWSKAMKDSAGLEAFHQEHKDDFRWEERYDVDIYSCADASVSKQARKLLKKGTRGADLVNALNESAPLAISIDGGVFTAAEKPFLAGMSRKGLSDDMQVDGRTVFVDLKAVVPAGPKTLEEARGLVTAAYQDHLEQEWIAELRARYPVQVNKDVLHSIK